MLLKVIHQGFAMFLKKENDRYQKIFYILTECSVISIN